MKKNSIELTKEQRKQLEEMIKKGHTKARAIQHAHVLLKIDSSSQCPNWSDEQLQEAFGVSGPTVWCIRRRFWSMGLMRRSIGGPSQNDQRSEKWMESRKRTSSPSSVVKFPQGTNGGACD